MEIVWRASIRRIGQAALDHQTVGSRDRLFVKQAGSILPTWIVPEGGGPMKRVKAACILQTLVFSQKDDAGFSKEQALQINREELKRYKQSLERTRTRYQILDEVEQDDGSIQIHVRKQYNDKADVSEYFV